MFKQAWGIIVSTNAVWDKIVSEKVPVKTIRTTYVYPWIVISCVLMFLFCYIYASGKAFELAIINTIIETISLAGGYFISNLICFAYLKKYKPNLASKPDCERLIAYSFTVIILIEIITIVAPSLFFLKILCMYIAYLLWEGCRAIWLLKEDDRGDIVLVFSITIIFVPIIIDKLIHWMLPNV